ncbi:Por secretion system C-terminal sorting domain-containing protein [Aquimarina amphilecti]|uniref:Por secretion system C-terminal sorting domain-containing protein n=1 Tax=Aquimarina amphilecti TaxID=1038014 RepID=A0A1H7Q8M3_AQUAM|nr:M14 family zinc carboxypeptidase [Aquimarina amphilecti]SEL44511.1 Por secretion system C-terminal sorting domain-containing protein [Aquimarina amphilecti]
MKKIFSTLVLLVSTIIIAQTKPSYSRAKITYNTPENFKILMDAGVPMDHGQHKRGIFIISDFSIGEIQTAKDLGFAVEIIIEDAETDFIKRNERAKNQKAILNLACPSGNGTNNSYPTPSNFSLGSMGGYLTYQEMLDNLDAMRAQYPTLISARADIGTFVTNGTPDNSVSPSIGGNTIQWVRISDNPDVDENESEILYDAIHHAREPASLSQLIYYMWYLLENYNTDPDIKQIVDNTELYFVPVINPDGYLYNQVTNPNGGGLWRKNRFNTHGVDNNRNYDHYPNGNSAAATWGGPGSSNNTNDQTYHGTSAFSEVENQAMKWFTEQHNFIIALNNHTFGELLYFPYSYAANTPTPDEDIFIAIGDELTSENGYNPLRDAPFAGDSDDFMYGGISQSHNKIFSFTPEVGTAFWPASNQIDGICKEMMYLNLTAAKMTNNYAQIESIGNLFVGEITSFNAEYTLKRLGITGNGDFTVTIVPVSTNITSVGSPKSYSNTQIGIDTSDNIQINLDNMIGVGDDISYTIKIDGGTITESIDVIKKYGSLQSIVNNDANSVGDYTQSGWSTTTATFVSPNASITESPTGNYGSNQNKTIELTQSIDLSTAAFANIQFNAKWDIENNWDYTQFEVSIDDGISWIPQCGKFTNTGSTNAGQPTGEPLYDGTQTDWILEEIDLSDYLGETIKVRFQFVSDGNTEEDGFFFDDLIVNSLDQNVLDIEENLFSEFKVFPNPAKDILKIAATPSSNFNLHLRNIIGQEIYAKNKVSGNQEFDISKLTAGLYFLTIEIGKNVKTFKIVKQ